MADTARYTGDKELFNTCQTIFNDITERKMYITGGIGSTKDGEAFTFAYDLPNDLAYSETCASIGLVFFARRMLQADYDSKYADIMERCFYNSILSEWQRTENHFSMLIRLRSIPKHAKEDSRKTILSLFVKKWFDCACCPPNLARIISDYGEYCFTETESTLFVNLYQGTKLETDKADIEIVSDYLQSGKVSFKIKQKDLFKIALRIPYWSSNFKFNRKIHSSKRAMLILILKMMQK